MSSRSLFIIVVRVIGILSLKAMILEFFNLISYITNGYGAVSALDSMVTLFIIQLIVFGAYFFVSYTMIVKAAFIVDRFRLPNDIEPVLQLSVQVRDVMRIALIVTATLLLVDEIPFFISKLADMFSKEDRSMFAVKPNYSVMIISGVKIVVGLLLIGERSRIIDLMFNESKDNKETSIEETIEENTKENTEENTGGQTPQ